MGATIPTETSTIINIEGTPTLSPTTTDNRILDGNNGNNEGNSSNTNNTGGTPTVTPTGDSSPTPTVTPGTTTSSTSTETSTPTPTVTPDRILDGNNSSNNETTPTVTPGTTTSSTSTVTFTPTPTVSPVILDGNNGSNTLVVTEEPGNTTTTSKTPSFTRLPGIHRYFPNYTNKSDTEISSDILALQEIGIIPIATKFNEIYYNVQELIVYYAYYINELSYTSKYEFETIDDAVNGAKSYIDQIEGYDGVSFGIGILHKGDYVYQTNYTKSQVSDSPEQTTPTTTASTTTTKADVKPTSIPPINVYADDGKNYNGGKYLTYKASGAVDEGDTVMSLPRILTPAYDNTKFEFLSEYDWYYMKNGEKVEVKALDKEEIPLGVLSSTSIYIKVSSMTSTSTVTETTTIPDGNNQSVTISSTEPATTQTPPPPSSSTSTKQAKTVRYGFMWN